MLFSARRVTAVEGFFANKQVLVRGVVPGHVHGAEYFTAGDFFPVQGRSAYLPEALGRRQKAYLFIACHHMIENINNIKRFFRPCEYGFAGGCREPFGGVGFDIQAVNAAFMFVKGKII